MVPAIRKRYGDAEAKRVVDAWNRGMAGEVTTQEWEGKGSQVAASYIEGLEAKPWHSIDQYPWISVLEENARVVLDELRRALSERLGEGAAWIPAAEEDVEAYGPGWQRLVLQNGDWDSAACANFPKTCSLLQSCGAPSHEVLFARQRAGSGIKPHTDNSNFFVTAHLALEVPDGGGCWIRVGTNEKREWLERKALAFDSSFVHETRNDESSDRIILLVRFWHPGLQEVEINALKFIFSALEDPSILDEPYDGTLGLKETGVDPDATVPLEQEASSPVSVTLDDESGQKHSSNERGTAQDVAPPESLEEESTGAVTLSDGGEAISVEPLGDAAEAERLDGFLADLKSEGLLPGAGTKDDVLAQGPKNRSERRKASKSRKKASRPARKGKRR